MCALSVFICFSNTEGFKLRNSFLLIDCDILTSSEDQNLMLDALFNSLVDSFTVLSLVSHAIFMLFFVFSVFETPLLDKDMRSL